MTSEHLPRTDRGFFQSHSLPRSEASSLPGRGLGDRAILPATLLKTRSGHCGVEPSKAMVRRVRLDREENAAPGSADQPCAARQKKRWRSLGPIEPSVPSCSVV